MTPLGRVSVWMLMGSMIPAAACAAQSTSQNTLSQQEVDAGWELLFDGVALDRWRGFGRDDLPQGWIAAEGVVRFDPSRAAGGDIITRDQFENFELVVEWRVLAGGNSGIFFGVSEDEQRTYHTGPEMQVLDNGGHPDGANPATSAGSNYGLHPPVSDVTRPVGDWNAARIVVDGTRVEHWLNGVRVVSYERWTDDWKALVAASKFVEWPGYGIHPTGHIGLQDHGDPVWFRNIKIRRLTS